MTVQSALALIDLLARECLPPVLRAPPQQLNNKKRRPPGCEEEKPSGLRQEPPQPEKVMARTALQGSKRGSKGGKNPLAPSSNQFENLPTAITDTEAPVVILKPVLALVARMPS